MASRTPPLAVLLLGAAVALAGCGIGAAASPAPVPTAPAAPVPAAHKLKVVTTVAPLTDIVRSVAGTSADVQGLIPDGVDSHTFEPPPSDARLLSEADLVILNGLHLETPIAKMAAANARPGAEVLVLGDHTVTPQDWIFDFSFPAAGGSPNPHLWLNVQYAMRYAELARDALVRLDPAHRADYERNSAGYLALLQRLDEATARAVQTIPPAQRKILTYHDSWPYFARRYGMTVVGAVQPADFAEPSATEVARLIDQLRQEKVPAVFGSEVFPSKVLEQIAREAGVRYVDSLRDDELPGSPQAPEHTYVGMMLANVRTIVTALGGDARALAGIEARPASTGP